MAFARASYYITLHSAAHTSLFADNTPLSFANVMADSMLLTSPLDYEVALLELHIEKLRTLAEGTLLVECSIAERRHIGDVHARVIRMLHLAPTTFAPDDKGRMMMVRAEHRSYQFDAPQYHPLDLFVANPLYDVRLTLTFLDEPLEITASEVFATLHVRRRADAPPFTQGVKIPSVVER